MGSDDARGHRLLASGWNRDVDREFLTLPIRRKVGRVPDDSEPTVGRSVLAEAPVTSGLLDRGH
jgi:hypothetical protein